MQHTRIHASNALLVMLLCLTRGADVTEQIQRRVNETIAENIAVLRAISDVVITLGRQGLPFRGHRDDHDVTVVVYSVLQIWSTSKRSY